MYFNNTMFNPQYVNQAYYNQHQAQIAQYNFQQDVEVAKAAKAMKMDDYHQQQAFWACLGVLASEMNW